MGRLPNKHFRGAPGGAKVASVSTLALLATYALPRKQALFRALRDPRHPAACGGFSGRTEAATVGADCKGNGCVIGNEGTAIWKK